MTTSDISSAIAQAAARPARSAAPPRRQIRLTGRSEPFDPTTLAVRRDLADIALADRVFSQHYAVPMRMVATASTPLRFAPQDDSVVFLTLEPGDPFDVLDLARDWAWGRGGVQGCVGYVAAAALVHP